MDGLGSAHVDESFRRFPLLRRYAAIRLGLPNEEWPEQHFVVVGSERRNHAELSYGYVRVVWWLRLGDDQTVVSVPPGCEEVVHRLAEKMDPGGRLPTSDEAAELMRGVAELQERSGGPSPDRVFDEGPHRNPRYPRLIA